MTLNIPGITNQTKSYVLPAGGSELVWFKWHTPSTPQTLNATYTVTTPYGSPTPETLTYTISALNELTPPRPGPRDTAPAGFYIPSFYASLGPVQNTLSWNEYSVTISQQPYTVTQNVIDPTTGQPVTQTITASYTHLSTRNINVRNVGCSVTMSEQYHRLS